MAPPVKLVESPQRLQCLKLLLRPVVKYLVQQALPAREVIATVRELFIECAEEYLRNSGQKPNLSKVSLVTGLPRSEVTRASRHRLVETRKNESLLRKIIGQWEQDKRFLDGRKHPRALTYGVEGSEFHTLVSTVTLQISPGAVAAELKRLGVASDQGGKLSLTPRSIHSETDLREGMSITGRSIGALLACASENLLNSAEMPNLHLFTEYDNVRVTDLPKLRRWMYSEGKKFHRRARDKIARSDEDISATTAKEVQAGGRVTICSFSFTDPTPPEPRGETPVEPVGKEPT